MLEDEAIEIQKELREAILNGDDRVTREAIKKKLGEKRKQLLEMRSLCVRMLRNTLNKEQFDKVVASYRAS